MFNKSVCSAVLAGCALAMQTKDVLNMINDNVAETSNDDFNMQKLERKLFYVVYRTPSNQMTKVEGSTHDSSNELCPDIQINDFNKENNTMTVTHQWFDMGAKDTSE
jgi:hypothetical protein